VGVNNRARGVNLDFRPISPQFLTFSFANRGTTWKVPKNLKGIVLDDLVLSENFSKRDLEVLRSAAKEICLC
jgi:hypothetical protein